MRLCLSQSHLLLSAFTALLHQQEDLPALSVLAYFVM